MSKNSTSDSEEFAPPPASAARVPDPAEEEAVQRFAAPSDAGSAESEVAAVSQSLEPAIGFSADLLAIKSAIEDQLQQRATQSQSAGGAVRSFEAASEAGNIQGVAIGYGDPASLSGGTAPGTPAITVYVAEPAGVDEVKSALVDSLGIRGVSSDDVPLHVVVTGLIDAQAHRWHERPAPGGISIGHYKITAGTLGILSTGLTAPRTSRVLILSNNHVLANSNAGVYGDPIIQPGAYDGGTAPANTVAILERFVPINFSGGANYVDAATGWAWPDRVRRELVYVSGGTRYYVRVSNVPVGAALGAVVGKSGRTTQLTSGRIVQLNATINVGYGGGKVALFKNQIAIQSTVSGGNFSAGGDSGSLIWTWNATRNPVGLLFAGGGATTFANPIGYVLSALNIRLYT